MTRVVMFMTNPLGRLYTILKLYHNCQPFGQNRSCIGTNSLQDPKKKNAVVHSPN